MNEEKEKVHEGKKMFHSQKNKYLQNKRTDCDLSMKDVSSVLFHQKFQNLGKIKNYLRTK